MFAALMSYIAGGARIKVRGLNLDRLLASLLREGFVLKNLKRPSYTVLVFDIDTQSRKRAAGFFKRQGREVEVIKEFGFPAAFKRLAGRLGLIAGLILCISGTAVYNGFIWRVRIEGTERINKADVAALLGEMGVGGGTAKKKIDRGEIAAVLNTKLPDAADVTVQMKGTSLIVRIYETLFKEGGSDPGASTHIVSAYDGIVTNVVALDGTALVEPGDIVKKGEILIAGYNLGADGVMAETRAAGEVTGKVFFTSDNVFFTQREEYVRTGSFAEGASLNVFGLKIRLRKARAGFGIYDKEESERSLFSGLFIPLKRTREKYFELELRTAEYDYEAAKAGIISSVKAAAEAMVPKDALIVTAKTDIRQIDKYVITMYNIETRMLLNA